MRRPSRRCSAARRTLAYPSAPLSIALAQQRAIERKVTSDPIVFEGRTVAPVDAILQVPGALEQVPEALPAPA
jgi:hypothetical protein